MQPDDLRRFADFADLDPDTLKAVVTAARRLRIPGGRWLIRPGRALPGYFYLLDGRVRLLDGSRTGVVSARSGRARRPIYPGPGAVQTITACIVASVAAATMEVARDSPRTGLGTPELIADDGSWQRRFLLSPLMQRLSPAAWQRLLRAMSRHDYAPGERVITRGGHGDRCYVLCRGRADIRGIGGRALATLDPGMLFGEDALITGGRRNADVVMREAGSAVSLAANLFRGWLLDSVAGPLGDAAGRRLLALPTADEAQRRTAMPGAATLALDRLRGAAARMDTDAAYAIVGGTRTQRQLAAFLLAEQGVDARPLETATDPA